MLTLTTDVVTDPEIVIRADRVFDGSNLRLGDFTITLSGSHIREMNHANSHVPSQTPPPSPTIDLRGMTLLPGLIDAHVHLSGRRSYLMDDRVTNSSSTRTLRAADDAARLLRAGYTTVRDVGSIIALALRDSVRDGTLLGPRILAAGPIISQTGGHADHHYLPLSEAQAIEGSLLADGIDECRKAVRQAVRMGADLVKICTSGGVGSAGDHPSDSHFTVDEVSAIVDEAHRLGRQVAAHAQGTDGILTALRAGVDTIEHATYLTEECARMAKEQRTWIVPTVALRQAFIDSLESTVELPPWREAKQRQAIASIEAGFKLAAASDLKIACGSDFTGIPFREHGRNSQEPIQMVALGFPPMCALRAATSSAAEMLGLADEVGSVGPGMVADLIAVKGDPLKDITALEHVELVISNGKVVFMTEGLKP